MHNRIRTISLLFVGMLMLAITSCNQSAPELVTQESEPSNPRMDSVNMYWDTVLPPPQDTIDSVYPVPDHIPSSTLEMARRNAEEN